MVAEETSDAASKAWHDTGTMSDPRIGGEKQVHSAERIVSPDVWVMEMYEPGPDGKEWKCMEITSTRKK